MINCFFIHKFIGKLYKVVSPSSQNLMALIKPDFNAMFEKLKGKDKFKKDFVEKAEIQEQLYYSYKFLHTVCINLNGLCCLYATASNINSKSFSIINKQAHFFKTLLSTIIEVSQTGYFYDMTVHTPQPPIGSPTDNEYLVTLNTNVLAAYLFLLVFQYMDIKYEKMSSYQQKEFLDKMYEFPSNTHSLVSIIANTLKYIVSNNYGDINDTKLSENHNQIQELLKTIKSGQSNKLSKKASAKTSKTPKTDPDVSNINTIITVLQHLDNQSIKSMNGGNGSVLEKLNEKIHSSTSECTKKPQDDQYYLCELLPIVLKQFYEHIKNNTQQIQPYSYIHLLKKITYILDNPADFGNSDNLYQILFLTPNAQYVYSTSDHKDFCDSAVNCATMQCNVKPIFSRIIEEYVNDTIFLMVSNIASIHAIDNSVSLPQDIRNIINKLQYEEADNIFKDVGKFLKSNDESDDYQKENEFFINKNTWLIKFIVICATLKNFMISHAQKFNDTTSVNDKFVGQSFTDIFNNQSSFLEIINNNDKDTPKNKEIFNEYIKDSNSVNKVLKQATNYVEKAKIKPTFLQKIFTVKNIVTSVGSLFLCSAVYLNRQFLKDKFIDITKSIKTLSTRATKSTTETTQTSGNVQNNTQKSEQQANNPNNNTQQRVQTTNNKKQFDELSTQASSDLSDDFDLDSTDL